MARPYQTPSSPSVWQDSWDYAYQEVYILAKVTHTETHRNLLLKCILKNIKLNKTQEQIHFYLQGFAHTQ